MSGTINGFPVVWGVIEPSTGALNAMDKAPFAEYQRNQYTGAQDKPVRCSCVITPQVAAGTTVAAVVEAIQAGAAVWPFAVIQEASGFLFGASIVYARIDALSVKRGPVVSHLDFTVTVLGTPETHAIGVVSTSRQITNGWGIGGRTTLRYPAATIQVAKPAITDAVRGCVEAPAYYASMEAAYVAGTVLRNGISPLLVVPVPSSTSPYGAYVKATAVDLTTIEGGQRDLALGGAAGASGKVRNVCLQAEFLAAAATPTVRFTDLLGFTGTATDMTFPVAYTSAIHGGVAMPGRPQRRSIILGNGFSILFQSNGNIILDPGLTPPVFKFPGATVRALGTGVHYALLRANTYLVGSQDFSIAADGTIGHTTGAVYDLVFSNLAGAPLLGRLKEAFAEQLQDWMLLRRTF